MDADFGVKVNATGSVKGPVESQRKLQPLARPGSTPPCIYLGPILDRRNTACDLHWLHQCALFETCTIAPVENGVNACQRCECYIAKEGELDES